MLDRSYAMAVHTCELCQTYRRDISVYDDKKNFQSVQWRDIFFALFRDVWGHAPLKNFTCGSIQDSSGSDNFRYRSDPRPKVL